MDAIITPGKLNGRLTAPPSKSHSHRLLIGAYLAGDPLCAEVPAMSEDIAATKECLETLFRDGNAKGAKAMPILDCRESGSTLRFLLPIAAALPDDMLPGQAKSGFRQRFLHSGRRIRFLRSGRLPERPLSPLREEMERHGVTFKEGTEGELTISGRMQGGEFTISGNVSSQFITGLLFALPLTEEGGSIRVTGTLASRPYVDMTLKVLRDFGIKVTEAPYMDDAEAAAGGFFTALREKTGTCFIVPGGQHYTAPALPLKPEGDWSNSAFFLVANALGSDVEVTGLNTDSPQGDKIITDIITGCHRYRQKNALDESASLRQLAQDSEDERAKDALAQALGWLPSELLIDAEDIPDLVPILAVLSWGTGVRMQIIGAGRLRLKESDRLQAVKALMDALGCPCEVTEDGLLVVPSAPAVCTPGGASAADAAASPDTGRRYIDIDGAGDHRIVMAAAIAATVAKRPVCIKGCEAVNKSWPLFFDTFAALGSRVHFS